MRKSICLFIVAIGLFSAVQAQHWQLVDPRIGSVGVGRTFPGPSMPFGMVKPGPDCGVLPNAGWAPMPAAVTGFTQTHVSGTGGGQKYGNVLVQPAFLVKRSSPAFTLPPTRTASPPPSPLPDGVRFTGSAIPNPQTGPPFPPFSSTVPTSSAKTRNPICVNVSSLWELLCT